MAPTAPARLRFEPPVCLMETPGALGTKIQAIAPLLENARRLAMAVEATQSPSTNHSPSATPANWAWLDRPRRLLDGYNRHRATSDLFAILRAAHRLRDTIDRVVVVGASTDLAAAQALMGACSDPYFNDLDRGGRGSRARLHFVGDDLDSDSLQALLRLLGEGRSATTLDQCWALVAVLPSRPNLPIALATRHLLAALGRSVGGDAKKVGDRFLPIGGTRSPAGSADWEHGLAGGAADWATQLGCVDAFRPEPSDPTGPLTALAAPGLLPAALLGIDIVRLLTGAVAFTDQFATAPIGANPALDFAAAAVLLADDADEAANQFAASNRRPLTLWARALREPAHWWATLFATSRRCGFVTHMVTEEWRSDPLAAVTGDFPDRPPVSLTNRVFPELMLGAVALTLESDRQSGRPSAMMRFPRIDEWSLGQFFQMMMIATTVEHHLLDSLRPGDRPTKNLTN